MGSCERSDTLPRGPQWGFGRFPYGTGQQQLHKWPVGQAVKTPPSHGGIMGSSPVRVTSNNLNRTPQLEGGRFGLFHFLFKRKVFKQIFVPYKINI